MSYIRVTQTASLIAQPKSFRKTILALGLGKISRSNILPDNNCTRGMLNQVKHMVSFELDVKPEVNKKATKAKAATKTEK